MKIRYGVVLNTNAPLAVDLPQARSSVQTCASVRGRESRNAMGRRNLITNTRPTSVRCGLTLAVRAFIFALLLGMGSVHGLAQENQQQQMRGLDEQVQEIKSDILKMSEELSRLEEKLLYPS